MAACLPGHRRPYYQPIERLSILELRAARGWTLDQTAERMLVTPATIASWMGRLDEKGPGALVQTPEPVNKFPAFVDYVVQRLKVLCPSMGKSRIANVLCRAGLHLSATTVGRMLKQQPLWEAVSKPAHSGRSIRAREPDHIWNVDLTTVPTTLGLWCSWLPGLPPAGTTNLCTAHLDQYTGSSFLQGLRTASHLLQPLLHGTDAAAKLRVSSSQTQFSDNLLTGTPGGCLDRKRPLWSNPLRRQEVLSLLPNRQVKETPMDGVLNLRQRPARAPRRAR